MGHGLEQVHIQPRMPGGPLEALNVRILRRLTRLDIQHRDPVLVGPGNQRSAKSFRAVVTAIRGRFSRLFHHLL